LKRLLPVAIIVGVLLAFALAKTGSSGNKAPRSEETNGGSLAVIVQNYYYAKPGKADEVYRWRLHASDVREKLGFARGRVLRRRESVDQTQESSNLPDVIWECEYANIDERERESTQVSATPEFQAVQQHMSTLIQRFDRATYDAEVARIGRTAIPLRQ